MKKMLTVLLISLFSLTFSQTIEQQLVVVQNDGVNGGQFNVAVEVKGTNLPATNTLGSATIDVVYDNTKLTFVGGTLWAFGSSQGYSRNATNNTTSIRVGVLGTTINGDGGGIPAGFDITSSYTTWVQLNFTILNPTVYTTLTIDNITNAIGLFANHANDPQTGVITNQPLTEPVNIIDDPLPVELSSFAAIMFDKDKVMLNWQTATEVKNYGFDVERQANSGQWEKVGFVNGNGNSNSPKEYSYIDKNLIGGSKFFYRLKQVNNDGQFTYTDAVEVVVVPNQYELSQNYPNPFNPSTKIKFSLPEAGKVSLKIYDMTGAEVVDLVNADYEAGYYGIDLNLSNLASGVYLYRFQSKGYSQVKKLMLLK